MELNAIKEQATYFSFFSQIVTILDNDDFLKDIFYVIC